MTQTPTLIHCAALFVVLSLSTHPAAASDPHRQPASLPDRALPPQLTGALGPSELRAALSVPTAPKPVLAPIPQIPSLASNAPEPTAAEPVGPDAASAPAVIDPLERLPLGVPAAVRDTTESPAESTPIGSGWVLNTVTALGIVLACILLLRMLLTRAAGAKAATGQGPMVEVLSRVSVAPRNHILLVRLNNRVLAVGDSPAGLRTLADISDPEEVADILTTVTTQKPAGVQKGFAQFIGSFHGDHTDRQRSRDEGADGSEYQLDRARDEIHGLLSRVRSKMHGGASRATDHGGCV